jgi:hypothetical protein
MKTKFIEGTDEQYSIREDGAVIRHYLKKGNNQFIKNTLIYEDVLMTYKQECRGRGEMVAINTLSRKVIQLYKNSTLHKYFGFIICPECNKKIKLEKYRRLCENCSNKKHKMYTKKYSKEQIVGNVSKSYASSKLQIPMSLITDELYTNYKATLLVKRKLAEKLNTKPAYL